MAQINLAFLKEKDKKSNNVALWIEQLCLTVIIVSLALSTILGAEQILKSHEDAISRATDGLVVDFSGYDITRQCYQCRTGYTNE